MRNLLDKTLACGREWLDLALWGRGMRQWCPDANGFYQRYEVIGAGHTADYAIALMALESL